MSGYRSGGLLGRLVTKSGLASQTSIGGRTPVTAQTTSVAGTYGSWVQVTASTTADSIITSVSARCQTSASTISGPMFVQLGTGGSGSESVIAEAVIVGSEVITVGGTPNHYMGGTYNFPIPPRVAVGVRLAVRVTLASVAGSAQSVDTYVTSMPYANMENA